MDDARLLLLALLSGKVRYEPWADGKRGELCFNGIRHCVRCDGDGVPDISGHLRNALLVFLNLKDRL